MSAAGAGEAEALDASPELRAWLAEHTRLGEDPILRPLAGGNSNETVLVRAGELRAVMRRPPAAGIDASAHNMGRELAMLEALARTDVPTPEPLGLCESDAVPEAPFLLMEAVEGVAIKEAVPAEAGDPLAATRAVGEEVTDALAELHAVPWREVGLAEFGRPEGFLGRQVGRWRKQYERYRHRELPDFERVAEWLEANRPPDGEPGILHGDFHVDNCLIEMTPRVRLGAIIDWEMSTIGDPLLDVGLFLGFWGRERTEPFGMPVIQGFSRAAGAPSREELARRYEERSGRSLERLDYYMALAFWKLAAIVEGAHAHYAAGRVDDAYSAALEHDVPALLRDARRFAGC